MLDCTKAEITNQLIQNGIDHLKNLESQRQESELKMLDYLKRFASRKQCWK